jgi:hypothetical protein
MNDAFSQWLMQMMAKRSAGQQPMGQGAQIGGWGGSPGSFGGPSQHWNGGQIAGGGNAQTGRYSGPPMGQAPQQRRSAGPQPQATGAQMSGYAPSGGMNLSSFTGGGGQMAPGGNAMQGLMSLYNSNR